MESKQIINKFGDNYLADEDTFIMGIDRRITSKIAERFQNRIVLETCTGAGFTTISLANVAKRVVTIDISEKNQLQAKYNIKIAGVENRVDFILGNSLDNKILNQKY
jgi:predicted O-methyltransferase YrrM